MVGKEQNESTSEAINREQQDEGQAQDVAQDALHPETGRGSVRGGGADPTRILPEDIPDLVEKMEQMVSSGRIDNGAYAGEPQHDDEEDLLGKTEDVDADMLLGEESDGSDQEPLIDLGDLADDGDDPLASVASRHGLEDEDNGDDDDDYDNADDLNDDEEEDEEEDDEDDY